MTRHLFSTYAAVLLLAGSASAQQKATIAGVPDIPFTAVPSSRTSVSFTKHRICRRIRSCSRRPDASSFTDVCSMPISLESSTSTVTSVAPPRTVPRIKLDLATVPIGTCVEIQLRSDEGNDALDLFKVDCAHKEGVYTVTARVPASYECRSVYVAAPPDRSFALCLNPF